jgi:multidrug resistance efflux pump
MSNSLEHYLTKRADRLSFESYHIKLAQVDSAIEHHEKTIKQMKAKIDKMKSAMSKIMEYKCNAEVNKNYLLEMYDRKVNSKDS